MLRIFGHDALQQRAGFEWLFCAQQALAQMRPGVDVLRVALQRRPVARLRLDQLSSLEKNVAQLEVVMRLIEVINLRLKLLDAAPVERASGSSNPRVAFPTAPRGTQRNNRAWP